VLEAEGDDLFRSGAEPFHPGIFTKTREVRIFAEQSIAGKHRMGPRGEGGLQQFFLKQITFRNRAGTEPVGFVCQFDVRGGVIRIGINRDAAVAELLESADGACGDFAAVGDKDVHGECSGGL